MQQHLPSIQRRILTSITVTLLVLVVTLSATFSLLLYRRITADLQEGLSKALNVAWQEYLAGPQHTLTALRYVAALNDFGAASESADSVRLQQFLVKLPNADFAAFIAPDGRVVAHTNNARVGTVSPLAPLVADALRTGSPQVSSEKMAASSLQQEAPGLAQRVSIRVDGVQNDLGDGLVQVIILPVERHGHRDGALVAGILLNNTALIPQAYTVRMPSSYLSISLDGVRISSNIITGAGGHTIGGVQTADLVRAVKRGERYYGYVRVDGEKHYVVSDPIRNNSGQVIGALSLGLPPSQFAKLQQESLIATLACAVLAFLLAVAVAGLVARRFSRPIVWLEQMALKLARSQGREGFDQAVQECLGPVPSLYSREITGLYQSFASMAQELSRRYRETLEYLARLEHDREELQALTAELQESKALLEQKVEERTHELEQAVVELQEASAHKSQFLATMSHELRTPLNSVIGFSEMLADELVGPLAPKQHEYLENVLSASRHLLSLITEVLDLSRIERGRLTLFQQDALIPELVAAAEIMVRNQVQAAGLTLTTEVAPDLPVVQVDLTRMQEVLYNLLSNAMKFTPVGGQIWLRARSTPDAVIFEVQDTGIGIKPEDQSAIFDEFVQAESAYHRRFEGAGLGLPLSKKLVELHGGRIDLESEVDRGTTVRVYLPRSGGNARGG